MASLCKAELLYIVSKVLLEEGMATHSSILLGRIPLDRRAWGYSPWGHKELDTTEGTEHACQERCPALEFTAVSAA